MNIITGMHRSGTSLVAQILNNLGVDLGPKEKFIPPDKWNPRGYYENSKIIEINNRCILGSWSLVDKKRGEGGHVNIKNLILKKVSKLQYFFLPSESKILDRARKMSEEIQNTSNKFSGACTKDARFLLTLNVWNKFGKVDRILFCLRHPYEVSKSLNKREGVPMGLAYKQWFQHIKRFLSSTDISNLYFVDYNKLLNKNTTNSEMRIIYSFLDLPFNFTEANRIANETIDFSLRNSVGIDTDVPKNILNFYKKIRFLHLRQNL